MVGTVGYMSPEQAGGDPVDFRSDQFALGAILYELATRRGPFQRRTPAETLTAILREAPPAVRSLNPQTPLGLARIVERCLAKAPSRRYASSLDLARDLREELERLPELGRGRAGRRRPQAARARRWHRPWPGRRCSGSVAAAASRSTSLFLGADRLPRHSALRERQRRPGAPGPERWPDREPDQQRLAAPPTSR